LQFYTLSRSIDTTTISAVYYKSSNELVVRLLKVASQKFDEKTHATDVPIRISEKTTSFEGPMQDATSVESLMKRPTGEVMEQKKK
jgi:hypothetical protein